MKSNRINRFLGILRRFLSTSAIVMSVCGIAQGASNTWTGATNANWNTATANWANPVTWSNGDAAVFTPGAGAVIVTEDIIASGLSISGSDSIEVGAGKTLLLDYATAVPAVDGGWGSHIAGSGILRLNSAQPVNGSANWGPNSATAISFGAGFTGTLEVDNGRMDASPASLGGITTLVMNNNAQFLAWTGTYPQQISIAGEGWGENGQPGALRAAGGSNSIFSGDITLLSDAGISSQTTSSVVTIDGVIGGSGNLTLHSRGQFKFNGVTSESYTGDLRINTTGAGPGTSHITFNKPLGTVAVPAGATVDFGFGTLNGQANLRMAASDQFGAGVLMKFNNPSGQWSRFDLMGTNQTLAGITTGNFTTQGAGVVQNREYGGSANRGNSTLTLNGNITDPKYPVGGYVFNGYVRDADSGINASNLLDLVKNGTGTQLLIGSAILYSGSTTVNAGTLVFSKNSSLNTSIANSATVEINSASGDDWILNNSKTLSGSGTWNKTGPGRASFNSTTLTTTGQINILEGTLRNNNNAGNWAGSTASMAISSGAILDLYADAVYVDKLTGSGTVQSGYGNSSNQSGAAPFFEKFVVGVANGSSTFAGSIRNNAGSNVAASGTAGGGLDLHKDGTGTLTLTGLLSYSGVTAINSGTLEIGGSTTNTLAGAITGSGALLKSGTGRLTLGGSSTFTGTTTITGGTLTVSGSAPSTPISVAGGATFGVSTTGKSLVSLTMASGTALSLPAATAQTTNAGTLSLTANPAFTVKPFFTAEPLLGTYDLLTPTSISGTAGTITTDFGIYNNSRGVTGSTAITGGKLVLTVTGTFTGSANLVWNNFGGTGNWSAVVPADNNFSNSGTPSMFYNLDNVAFNGAAAGTVNLVGTLYPGSVSVDSSTGNYTFAGSGTLSGPTTLVKSGTSSLTLTTSNSYTGGTTLNAGTLNANAASSLGNGSLTLNGGILSLGAANVFGGSAPGLSFPTGSSATVRLNGNPLTIAALNNGFPFIGSTVIESGSATAGVDVLTANLAMDNTYTGILRNGATRSLALTKSGAGTLALTGSDSNTHTGDTTLLVGRIGLAKTGGAYAIPGNFIGDNGASPDLFTTENNQFASGCVMSFVNPTGDHFRFELLGTTQTLAGIDNSTANGRGVIQHREQAPPAEITTQSTLVLNIAESATYYYDGYLRGNGSSTLALVKNGPGTQSLAGPNLTYTGGTTINAGILDFVGTNSMDKATGPWTINQGATVRAVASQNLNGGMTMNGGTLAGSGASNDSYGHVVLGSNLTVGGTTTSVISADLRVGSNADRIFDVAATGVPSGIDLDITGKIGHTNNVAWGYMTKTGAGTMRFSNPALKSDIGRITLNQGKIIFQDMIADMGNGGLINEAVAEVSTNTGVAVTYGSTMSGSAGQLQKTGPGSLTLTNASSSFSGDITISGGTLSLPSRSSYGNIAVASGTTLAVSGSNTLTGEGLSLANGSTLEINNFVGDEVNPPLEVLSSITTAGTVQVIVSGIKKSGVYPLIFYPFGGSVGGAGVGAFSLESPSRSVSGSLVDNPGNASVDLNVTITPVKWKGNVAGGVWDIGTTANWTFKGSATTYQDGDFLSFEDSATTFAVTLNETVAPTAMTFDNTTHDYSVGGSGSISGAATLTKNGGGMLTLTGNHTYTGLTTVADGTLRLGDGSTNGSIASVVANESILLFQPAAGGQTYGTSISGTGALAKQGAATLTLAAANSFTGDITVNGGKLIANGPRTGTDTPLGASLSSRTITVNSGTILEFARANVFGNHNTTTVPTLVVNGGTVTNADPAATNRVNNGLNNIVLNSGTLTSTTGNNLEGDVSSSRPSDTYGTWGLNGSVTSTGSSFITTTAVGTAGRLLLSSTGSDTVFEVTDGTLAISAPLQGGDGDSAGLHKTGEGKLVLSAVNVYRGPTTVTGGTLELNGSLIKTDGATMTPSNVTVNSGATLAGSGTATGTVTIESGAFVAPGSGSIAALHTGSTTINGTYNCDVGAVTSDSLAITGDLDLTGATIAISTAGTPAAATYVIASYTGTYAGGPPAVTGLPSGYSVVVDGTSKQVQLVGTGSGYSTWADSWTSPALSDKTPGGDPDEDGISNLMEYVIGGDPRVSSTQFLPTESIVGSNLVLSYKRSDASETDTTQVGQWSNNLSNWNIGTPITPVLVNENGADPDDMTISIPLSNAVNGKLFGRLQVIMP